MNIFSSSDRSKQDAQAINGAIDKIVNQYVKPGDAQDISKYEAALVALQTIKTDLAQNLEAKVAIKGHNVRSKETQTDRLQESLLDSPSSGNVKDFLKQKTEIGKIFL